MIDKCTVCLRELGKNRAEEVKFGRMLSNSKVTEEELINTITAKVVPLVTGKHVLSIQDTTEINYQAHADRVSGLGIVGNGRDIGFFLHLSLVLDAKKKVCLGLGSIKTWTRAGMNSVKKSKLRSIEEKESFRWIEAAKKSQQILNNAGIITIIADRESDIYEELYRIPNTKTHLIIRACQNRYLTNQKRLLKHINALPVAGLYELKIAERPRERSAHVAKLEIRFDKIEIQKPIKCTDKSAPGSVQIYVVDVRELPETVPPGEEPIHWRLLTTHTIETVEQALQIVEWYCLRWNIEQLFRTLKKQGLNIESSQIERGDILRKLCIIAIYVAMIIMQLTLARDGKDQTIDVVFDKKEQQLLQEILPKLEGKTRKQKNLHPHDCLSWAAWIIARLGGWKGYKSESPPGPITMFRGLKKFQDLLEGYNLAKKLVRTD